MTIVNESTGEIVDTIGADEARRLTTEAKNEFRSSREHFDRAWSLIEAAVEGGGHLDLGYRSPSDYLHAEFDGALSGLDVPARRTAVRTMTDWGLSTRAIAKPLGVDQKTVVRDIARGEACASPAPTIATSDVEDGGTTERPSDEAPAVVHPEGESSPPAAATPAADQGAPEATPARPPVIGIDGKTYAPPTSTTPKPSRSPEQQNAEENSQHLARSLIFLLAFQHPNMRDHARDEWQAGRFAVSPTNRGYVTPNHMREAAEGLVALADEWESQ